MNDNLKEVLSYSPVSGEFIWLSGTHKAGKVAGSVHKTTGYIEITYKNVRYYAHRLAWFMYHGVSPDYIDHINGNKSDNRISNLRNIPKQENHRNMKCFSNSKSKVVGVTRPDNAVKWRASITVNRKLIHLGCFSNFEDAVAVRKMAEQHYGFHANHGRQ